MNCIECKCKFAFQRKFANSHSGTEDVPQMFDFDKVVFWDGLKVLLEVKFWRLFEIFGFDVVIVVGGVEAVVHFSGWN